MTIPVLLVGDHEATLRGLAEVLRREPQLLLVGQQSRADADPTAADVAGAEVALIDVPSGTADGALAVTAQLRRVSRLQPVLYLEDSQRPSVREATRVGVRSMVSKGEDLRELVRAVAVATTESDAPYLSPALTDARAKSRAETMTDRQKEVLKLLADGRDTDDIADELDLAPDTVKFHIRASMDCLGVDNRTAAVAQALRLALIR